MMTEHHKKVVRAERFELVDSEGEPRAVIDTGSDDTVGITLLGSGGTDRISLGTHPDGSATIALQDEDGVERVKMSANTSGPVVNIKDERGHPRIQLQVRENGTSDMILVDENQNIRVRVSQVGSREGNPRMALLGNKGEEGIYAQVSPEGYTMIGHLDEQGEVKIALGVNENGSSTLVYQDEDGENQAVF